MILSLAIGIGIIMTGIAWFVAANPTYVQNIDYITKHPSETEESTNARHLINWGFYFMLPLLFIPFGGIVLLYEYMSAIRDRQERREMAIQYEKDQLAFQKELQRLREGNGF